DTAGLQRNQLFEGLAERGGFEPPIRLPVCRISSAVRSTTLPPLRGGHLSNAAGANKRRDCSARCRHSGARRRREPGIQKYRHSLLLWIPGPPLRGVPE